MDKVSSGNSRRRSFYNRLSVSVQIKNDDDAERAIHRKEGELEAKLSRMSVTNSSKLNPVANQSSNGDVPLIDLHDHFQTCIQMFTANKINKTNAWQLNIFDYLSKVLNSNEEICNILQVAATSFDIGAKIYSVRVDGIYSDVLELANALSKVNIKDEENSINKLDNSYAEQAECKSKKSKKKRNLLADVENRITIYTVDEPLTALIKKDNYLSNQLTESNDGNSLFNVQFCGKPGLCFELMTPQEGKHYKWSELGTTREKTRNISNVKLSVLEPLSTENICPSFIGFAIDENGEKEFTAGNELLNESKRDADGNLIHYLDPDLDSGNDEPEENTQLHQNPSDYEVFITDMKPGIEASGMKNLEYTYKPLPTVSNHFQIMGVWTGPAHWKHKSVRRPLAKCELPKHEKKPVRRPRKCKPFEYVDFTIHEIKELLVRANKRTVRNTKNTEEACTYSKHMDTTQQNGISLMNRPNVKIYRIDNKAAVVDLNVSNYEYNNPNDSQYCSNNTKNDWGDDDLNDGNNPSEFHNEANNYVQELHENNSFALINKPESIVTGTFVPYAQKAKKMDMKKLKNAMWEEIRSSNGLEKKKDNKSDEVSFCKIYKDLPKKLTATMSENLSFPLAFVALLHLANENNLSLASDNLKDVIIQTNE